MNFVFLGLTGSHAYGLDTDESDEDWRGVFHLPTNEFLRIREPNLVIQPNEGDTTYWEIKHFFGQLVKGSQNAHELLWLPEEFVSISMPVYDELRLIRTSLMHKSLWEHWGGFTRSYEYDVKKYVDSGNKISAQKHAMHYVRLARGRFVAATEGRIQVLLPDDLRSHLRSIRAGSVPVHQAMDEGKEWDLRAVEAYTGWAPKAETAAMLDDILVTWRQRWMQTGSDVR